jgi:surfactin synthase thioesterase subunit
LPLRESPIYALPDRELIDAVDQRYGGIPAAVQKSPDLLRLVLPALRGDLAMAETYQHIDEPPLEVEIFALGGSDDPAVSPAELDGWRHHTAREFSLRLIPGGHFFLFSGGDGTASAVVSARSQQPAAGLQAIISRIQHRISHANK